MLFAILLGFATSNRRKRLELIRTRLRNDDANLLGIYQAAKTFNKKITNQLRSLIDNYLISQLDYKLVDYHRSSPSFLKLTELILGLRPRTKLEEDSKDHMLNNIRESMKNQKEVIYAVNDKMMFFEWVVLISLGFILIFFIVSVNPGGFIPIIVIPMISLAIVLLLLILRDLNRLKWQEDRWIWKPLLELFIELDLEPYILQRVVKEGHLKVKDLLKKTNKYRLVSFPNKYPNISGKKVDLVNLDE